MSFVLGEQFGVHKHIQFVHIRQSTNNGMLCVFYTSGFFVCVCVLPISAIIYFFLFIFGWLLLYALWINTKEIDTNKTKAGEERIAPCGKQQKQCYVLLWPTITNVDDEWHQQQQQNPFNLDESHSIYEMYTYLRWLIDVLKWNR